MARLSITSEETAAQEQRLLNNLLGLYGEESRLYNQVLALSRRQGDVFRNNGSFREVREIMEAKMDRLNEIARLEAAEKRTRSKWDAGKEHWSSAARARLHEALQAVGALIEEILLCEGENDRLLLHQTRKM
jgi:hypothetical protein